ncbi:MAG: SDR family NAD(P)-dependent oxidoreductase, partial [Pseudolabrys sp.]
MDLGLEDKVALVSGGTSGIGLAISKRLSGEGCKVAIAGRERTKLERALAQINRAQGFVADVREPTQVKALVENVIAAFGRIDIVVSNAGTHLAGRLEDVESSAFQRHFETKVMGAWELAKCVAPYMRRQGGGRFIVIIGQAGKVPQANGIASTISNAAQHAFVKSLSDDLARHNI